MSLTTHNVAEPESTTTRVGPPGPPGSKVVATAMEVGLVRDFVDKSLFVHERLLDDASLIGKAYGFGFLTVHRGVDVAAKIRRLGHRLFVDLAPSAVVQTTADAQVEVWHRWVTLDDTLASKVSHQLHHHPLLRKTPGEVLVDVKCAIKGSRVWKGTAAILDSVTDIIDKFRRPGRSKEKDTKSGDEAKDVPEPFPKEAADGEKKTRRKKSRGLTHVARELPNEADPLVHEHET